MIEQVFFFIGLLVAALPGLALVPLLQRRTVRITALRTVGSWK